MVLIYMTSWSGILISTESLEACHGQSDITTDVS